jgi:hypothetical protein
VYLGLQTILPELWSAVYSVLGRQRVPHSVAVVVDSGCFGLDQKTTRQSVAVGFADCFDQDRQIILQTAAVGFADYFGQGCQIILQSAAADFVVDLCPQKGFDSWYSYSAMSQIVHPPAAYFG